jgi:hypothetical protein
VIQSKTVAVNDELTQDWRHYLARRLSCTHRQELEMTRTTTKPQQGNSKLQPRQGNVYPEPQKRNLPVTLTVKHINGSGIELHLSLKPPTLPKTKQLQLP